MSDSDVNLPLGGERTDIRLVLFSTFKLSKTMRTSSIFLAVLGANLIGGCQAPADNSTPPTSNGGSTSASSSAPPPPPHGESLFIQTFPEAGYPTPDTTTRGRFAIKHGCLVFEAGGETFRAILPAGSRFSPPDSIVLAGGGRAELGREVVVKGGEGEFGAASAIPAACPQRALLIGGV